MKYVVYYKDEVVFHAEITDYAKLVNLMESEEGREIEEPLDFFFESVCQIVLEDPSGDFGFLEDSGAKIDIIYKSPVFDKAQMKAELY